MEMTLKFSIPDDVCIVHHAIRAIFNLACETPGYTGIRLAQYADAVEKRELSGRKSAICRDCREYRG